MSGLSALLDTMRTEAQVLRRNGAESIARLKESVVEEVERAEPDAVRWISEAQAVQRSGWSLEKVRKHASQYRHTRHAVRGPAGWRMLAVIVPQRVPPAVLERAMARDAAR